MVMMVKVKNKKGNVKQNGMNGHIEGFDSRIQSLEYICELVCEFIVHEYGVLLRKPV